ncbi:MAG: hypothetical protein Kow0081_0800 [Candidatus Dojkabacteria bacterium]
MKLKAQERSLTGKKVKHLRKSAKVPGSVYGPGREPQNIQVDEKELKTLFNKVGYSKFVDLEIEGGKAVKVLIKEINFHPIKDNIVDVSLYAVDESRKLTAEVPVEITGESPAVKQKLGFLVQQLESIKVHCLPKDLPNTFEISASKLETAADTILVSDIQLPDGVELDSSMDPNSAIVYIATAQKEIVDEEAEGLEVGENEEEEGAEGEEEEKENNKN